MEFVRRSNVFTAYTFLHAISAWSPLPMYRRKAGACFLFPRLLDTSLSETLLIHPCTMSQSRYHTRVISYIDSPSLFANLFSGSCRAIPVLAHLLFCLFSPDHLPHPAGPFRLSIFLAHRPSFPARLLPCEDCSICPVAPLHGNIFA